MQESAAYYLGLDIGGTKSAVVIGDSAGNIIRRKEWPSEADRGPEAMLERLEREAAILMKVGPVISGAGVSIGGPLDSRRGIIYSPPNLPGWEAIPLKSRLERNLNLRVKVCHDAAACALAEHRWGAGVGTDILLYLTCGTGFGVGIVVDGRAYSGADGRSPEIGHWRYADDGPVAFGKAGSVEAFCSGSGLGKLAAWKFPARWGDQNLPTGKELAAAAASGDPEAGAVLAINARAVGRVASQLADLFRPECILLGSLVRYLDDSWLDDVRTAFDEEILPGDRGQVSVMPAALGERLQDCSAIAAAMAAAE